MEGLTFTNHFSESQILRRMRGASGAEVCLMQGQEGLFVRKWASGKFAGKLRFQEEWLREKSESGFTPRLLRSNFNDHFAAIDMEYLPQCKTLAEFLDENPLQAVDIFLRVLSHLQKLHRPKVIIENSLELLREFLQKKLCDNLQACAETYPDFAEYSHFQQIELNGQLLPNWPELSKKVLQNGKLLQEMSRERLVETHGDPTFSNILIDPQLNIFLIDPNNDNLFSTASLDYAKLLQSLALRYEALEAEPVSLTLAGCSISYRNPKPAATQQEFAFHQALAKTAPAVSPRVMQLWLATHLARILPYRLRSGDRRAWIYFGEMLRALQAANA